MSNFMKMHPMGAELFYVARWIDRHNNANSHFLQLCEHAYKGINFLEPCFTPSESHFVMCKKKKKKYTLLI